jgi:nucleotide-binding universal stress UspA family protein
MFKKILCSVDGSEHAAKALDIAIDMTKKYEAELVILHALHRQENMDALQHFAEVEGLAKHVDREMERLKSMDYRVDMATGSAFLDSSISPRLLVELGQHILDGAKGKAERKGLEKVDIRLENGDPADRILNCIDKDKIDCVILGSRGLNDLKGLFLGSVSHKVTNRAPCTCIAVK